MANLPVIAQNLVQAAQVAIGQSTPVLDRHAQNWHPEASAAVVAVLRELASDGTGVLLNAQELNGLADEIVGERRPPLRIWNFATNR